MDQRKITLIYNNVFITNEEKVTETEYFFTEIVGNLKILEYKGLSIHLDDNEVQFQT